MVVRYYSSTARETTLSSSVTSGTTTIMVGSVLGFPSNTPYTLALSYETVTEELVQVEAAVGTSLTISRGIDGTSATSHTAGARVRHVTSARDETDSRNHENADQGVHGLAPGDVLVGQSATQTLTNKTLTNPTINSPTVTNPTVNGTQAGDVTYPGTATYTGPAAIRITDTTDASPTSTNHPFQIGPTAGNNIRIDGNEVMAVNNGTTAHLILNPDGGNVSTFVNESLDSTSNSFNSRGVIDANTFQVGRANALSSAFTAKADSDAVNRFTMRADGLMSWSDGAVTSDTNLFRGGADLLRTNDSLTVDGTITSNTIQTTAGIRYRQSQVGTHIENFVNDASNTSAIVFPVPFTATPIVNTNINSGAGETARWGSRAISITNTGFTLFVFSNDGVPKTWSGIAVQWEATASN